jgi:hypothetical protein
LWFMRIKLLSCYSWDRGLTPACSLGQ